MPKSLKTLKRWVDDWEEATEDAQDEAEVARNYYDGKQWTDEEKAQLEARGQPIVTINLISKRINAIVGTEISLRTDPGALPRTPQHENDTDIVEDALRYVADEEDLDTTFTTVAEQMAIEGYSGVVVEIEREEEEEILHFEEVTRSERGAGFVVHTQQSSEIDPELNIRVRPVFWDRLFYDPHSRKKDFSDARYKGVVTWMDLEDAIERYGEDKRDILESGMFGAGIGTIDDTLEDRPRRWFDRKRKRVRVFECYYQQGKNWFVTHFNHADFLVKPKPTGLMDERGRHHVCPLIMAGPFVDRENCRYGYVRHMISPTDEVNKRRSKALDLITRRQVIAESGATDNPHSTQVELAKPDGYIEVQPGLRFEVLQNQDLATAQFQLLQEAKADINEIGPTVPEFTQGGPITAREVAARIETTQKELKPFFDVMRVFKRQVYKHIWMRVRQFWTQEKWIRVRDNEQGWRFVALNQRITRAQRVIELLQENVPLQSAAEIAGVPQRVLLTFQQIMQTMQQQAQQTGAQFDPAAAQQQAQQTVMQMPEMQEFVTKNEIARLGMDIILTEVPDSSIIEQEEFDSLVKLAASGTVQIPAEVIIEAYQGRSKKKMLEILRQPPDDTAARVQQALAQSQIEQGQAFAAQAVADAQRKQAQVQETLAKTAKVVAETQTSIPAEAQKDQAIAMRHAAEAGQKTVPLASVNQ